jgi:hypothetical protein
LPFALDFGAGFAGAAAAAFDAPFAAGFGAATFFPAAMVLPLAFFVIDILTESQILFSLTIGMASFPQLMSRTEGR